MRTKIQAAKIATAAGCAVAIVRGDANNPLRRLTEGARATWFVPHETPKAAYKAWIAGALAPQGALRVDAGAVTALRAGKSLLPAGVTEVSGKFEKGDAVRILSPEGGEIARGLACYDAADAAKIKGLKSAAIEAALGYQTGAELIHADDLVLT
jgi:glutamate 5-kinase